jgi:TonB family protein
MRKARILAALCVSGILFPPSDSVAQTKPTESNDTHGSICVLPNPPQAPTRISPGGEYNPETLMLRIDEHKPTPWPHKQPVLIDGLDLQANHLVVLISDGKRIQSFRFKFSEDDDAKLCIYYDGYQGVQLGNKKNADWCSVKVQACWRNVVRGVIGDIPGGLPPDGASAIGGILSIEPQLPRVASPSHIRVAQGVMRSLLLTKVSPRYPPEAERQHVEGAVLLHINIDKNGNVSTVEPVSGNPLLIPASVDAVKQWKYEPYLLNQAPIEVETTVLIKFVISSGNAFSVIAFGSPNSHSWR